MQLLIKIQDLYFTSSTLLKHKPDEHFTARTFYREKFLSWKSYFWIVKFLKMSSFLRVFAILRGSSCSDVTLPVSAQQECPSHLLHLKLDECGWQIMNKKYLNLHSNLILLWTWTILTLFLKTKLIFFVQIASSHCLQLYLK